MLWICPCDFSHLESITFWVALLVGSQQMVLMRLLSSLTQYANDAAKRAAGTCPFLLSYLALKGNFIKHYYKRIPQAEKFRRFSSHNWRKQREVCCSSRT